ncbi:MAG: DUF4905 domain-containing protein [Ignavibacterium sp.]|jgi:methyl coenzyme M reductase subunit D|nr:DUF4905 domain-containing protein [Ignavibacterium sp.]
MKIKKLYKHDNKKQIWRILPTAENKVVLEERDPVSKEVFFCCFDIESGKKVFNQWQLDEKNWCGIESIYKDIIYFHLYGKPDMPDHKSIIAFDIKTQEILWSNDSLRFSSVYDDKVYCFKQGFESSIYYSLDYLSGDIIEDLGTDISTVKQIKEKSDEEFWKQNYLFPSYFKRTDDTIEDYNKYLKDLIDSRVIKGEISFIELNDLLLYSFHEVSRNNSLNNIFCAYDRLRNKIVLEETLDKNLANLIPESFFVKDNFLFLIVDKTKLIVHKII